MRTILKQVLLVGALACALAITTSFAQAGEIGHFVPGIAGIRDYVVPEPGFYSLLYNYRYSTNSFNDREGNKVSSLTINPRGGRGVTRDVDLKADVYAVSPMFLWVSEWKIAGARYAAYIAPSFASTSLNAELSTARIGERSSKASQFGVGDLFVQPLWLGWSLTNWEFALGYGFYAPIGDYSTKTVTRPLIGSFTTESADNIGLGFWTHQIQGAAHWYPWEDKRMAVSAALTYEIHHKKKEFDLTPGQNLTFNWGVSQYLPLVKDQKLLLEFGPAGYSSWQTTDDYGRDASNPGVHDQVHAVGGQLGLTYVPWMLSVNLLGFYEYYAVDRFQGSSFSLNIAKKF